MEPAKRHRRRCSRMRSGLTSASQGAASTDPAFTSPNMRGTSSIDMYNNDVGKESAQNL